MTGKRCFALDLKDKPELIEQYKNWHKSENVWPEVVSSIKDSGIENMEIFLLGNRLFMTMEVSEQFCLEAKGQADKENPKVQEWETLMSTYQQALPWAESGQKWLEMEQIFSLK